LREPGIQKSVPGIWIPGLRAAHASRNDGVLVAAVVLISAICLDAALHAALAQTPFGAPRAAAPAQVGGVIGWLLARQAEFYREISTAIRAAKSDGSAVWTLLLISFGYGVFMPPGPAMARR
jgi:hypothetical protein